MTIVCMMPISTNIQNTVLFNQKQLANNNTRLIQYQDGFDKFFALNKKYIINKTIDVVITDNTCNEQEFPSQILDVIKKHELTDYVKIICHKKNVYGAQNKGCGVIEQWLYNKNIIQQYDWFIHFEPRQLLKSNQFIDSFLEKHRNLFTLGACNNHFNTGLFCIKTDILLQYISMVRLDQMVRNYISIEHDLFNYFKNIEYDVLEKMDLIWFNSANDKEYEW